jgi:prepilin-type N-terminal cleavage/methylation domain-containing protein
MPIMSFRPVPLRDERGLTLIEVMVSLAVSLVVLAGSFTALNHARLTAELTSLTADGTQNLRAAVVQMTRDIIQTGRELPNAGIPIPFGTSSAVNRPLRPGTTQTFPTTWETLPSICPGSGLGSTINGVATDTVTVLYSDQSLDLNQYPLTSVQSDGSRMAVDSRTAIGAAANGIKPGDLVWFTNALGNAVQTATSVSGQNVYFASGSTYDYYGLNARTASQGTILQIRSGSTFPVTSATRVVMVTYYLDTTTVPGQLRLMRRIGFGTPRLIATGIENLQVTYDIVDGTTNPTNQPTPVSPNIPSQIRKVNLWLSEQSAPGFSITRRLLRSSVATQVSLRSMSFFDRYR